MGTEIILGNSIGALLGGILMKIGRRNALFVCLVIGILANSICIILDYYTILAGWFLFGLSTGLMSSIVPRYIEETVPIHLFENIAPMWNMFQSFG